MTSAAGNNDRHEKLRIGLLLLLSICGAIFYFANQKQVFPSASIDLKCSKEEILHKSIAWAKAVGYDKTKTIDSTYFSEESSAKTFLEYEMGTEKANSLMLQEIPVWFWHTRLCKESEDEEFSADLSPSGALINLDHDIPNDTAMPSIAQDKAEVIAHDFVEKQVGMSLAKYKSIEKSSDVLAHRTDHSFTWEDQSHDYNGAHLRVEVGVSGKTVSSFNHFLHVPETWDRKFSTVRTYNSLLRSIADVFSSGLSAASGIAFIWALSSGNIRFKFAILAGCVFAFFGLTESLNNFSSVIASYNTSRPFSAFIFQSILGICLSPLGQFLYGAALWSTGEIVYRYFKPEKQSLEKLFFSTGLSAKSVIKGLLLGYVLCGIDLGWSATYYLTGYKFGYWCPMGVENYQTLSSYFPFLSAMHLGLSASSLEEVLYRVIGICLIQRATKSFWIANIVQAVVWGFMHSTYPQQPCYARGIELSASGMLYGWIFNRYGLIPCFVSHYLYDAYCGVTPLLSSARVAWTASFAILPFAGFAAYGWWQAKKAGKFSDETEIANESIPIAKKNVDTQSPEERPTFDYVPLSKKWRLGLIIAALIGAGFNCFLKPQAFIEKPTLNIGRHEAVVAARHSLELRGISHKGMTEVVTMSNSSGYSNSLQYIYEKVGFKKTAQYVKDLYLGYIWSVRFFRPLQSQEYRVTICGDTGKEYGYTTTKEEDAAGARISKDEARKLSEKYLQEHHPEYCPFEFDSDAETKRKNRTDHAVTFKVPRYKVAEADFKATVWVVGNEVSSFMGNWSIPAKWTFEYSKTTTKDEILIAVNSVLGLITSAAAIWWGVGVLRSGAIRWRQAIVCAIPLGLFPILKIINQAPQFYMYYGNTTPMSNFLGEKALQYFGELFGGIVSNIFLFSFGFAVLRILFPNFSISALLRTTFVPSTNSQRFAQREIWLDAILMGYCFNIACIGRNHIFHVLFTYFSPVMHIENHYQVCWQPYYLNYPLSLLSIEQALMYCLGPLLAAGIFSKYFRNRRTFFVFIFLFAVEASASSRYWQDFLIGSASSFTNYLIFWLMVVVLTRTNALSYMLLALVGSILTIFPEFAEFGSSVFPADVLQLAIILLFPLLYLAYLFRPRKGMDQLKAIEQPQDSTPSSAASPIPNSGSISAADLAPEPTGNSIEPTEPDSNNPSSPI